MATIELNSSALKHNFDYLDSRLKQYNKTWGIVSKLLCGNSTFLEQIIKLNPSEIHDSRLSNLEKIKKLAPHIQRVYIKPPPLNNIARLVACADVSFNTSIKTIKAINEEAALQKTVHKIIIMVELGDLREGIMGEHLIAFYEEVFELKNIQVIGLGTNLNCLNGVLPSKDKLIQLSLYKELINAKFNASINWVSAGASITLPLLHQEQVPKGCNHFRIGETLFFGNNIFDNVPYDSMRQDVFRLKAQVIELKEKPMVATGVQGTNIHGEQPIFDSENLGKKSIRAIVDLGALDIAAKDLKPMNSNINILGGSSDMIVLDLGDNSNNIKLGDELTFDLNYTGVLSLMSSDYIDKIVV